MISVVIVCAGNSTRMNLDTNKVLLPLGDSVILMHSVSKFKEFTDDIIVVCNQNDIEEISKYHSNVTLGGTTREESVYNGISKAKYGKVFVHDGARPFVSREDILKLIESTKTCELAFLGATLIDSVKNLEYKNLKREEYVLAYTPQYVKKDLFIKAYEKRCKSYTDDVSLVSEELNIKPTLVQGNRNNTKITTIEDYLAAKEKFDKYRIGHSWDIHRLVAGRELYLGGIHIPFEKGLLGHSDADCLLHAISESLLGALSLGDLGTHFPDNDPKYKGIDSKILLAKCYEMVKEKGYKINNLDTMIYLELPKMKPYINMMRESIAAILEINVDQVSIKATTYEKLGEIGQGLAIAAESTVLLVK